MKRFKLEYLLFVSVMIISCFSGWEPREYDLELSFQIIDSSTVNIKWKNYLYGVENFVLEKKMEDGEFSILGNFDKYTTNTTDTVTINKEYQYRCYAVAEDTVIDYSNIINVMILEDYFKSFELYVELIDSTTIKLSWEDVYDNEVGYIIEWSVANRNFTIHDGILPGQSNSFFIDDRVSPYANFRYRMYATLNGRNLPYSNIVSINPEGSINPYDINLEMIYVEGDTFQMGDLWGDGLPDEKPIHDVFLNNFYISKYEITQEQYAVIMKDKPSTYKYMPEKPAECIKFYNALKFCNRLSEIKGYEPVYTFDTLNANISVNWDTTKNGYRLPTEAEWEYAARSGGHTNQKWSGTNSTINLTTYACFNSSGTFEIGTKNPNQLGIYDMSGNIMEWCWDGYQSNYYNTSPLINPRGYLSSSCQYRSLRGGSYHDKSSDIRNAIRIYKSPTSKDQENGFRVCRNGD